MAASASTPSSSSIPATHSSYRWTGTLGDLSTAIKLDHTQAVPTVGAGQVLIRVRAVALNYRDNMIAKGQYPMVLPSNGIPVSDGAGDVVSVDAGASPFFSVGDRVVGAFLPNHIGGSPRFTAGLTHALGGDLNGMLAQYVVAHHSAVAKLPPSISYEEAATLPCAGVTAYNALYSGVDPLRPDHTVLVEGTGGVSILAAQIALAAGARVLVTSSSDEKLAKVQQLLGIPAEDCINYKEHAEWGTRAKELTGGLGVDNVLEVGGPNTIQQAIAATRIGGEIGVIGMVGGFTGANLDPLSILFGGVTVRGVLTGSVEHLKRLVDQVARGKIHPIIDRVFPFADAIAAFQYLDEQKHIGKVVIRID